jgi:SAM-dependent methyltransferase
MGSIEIFEKHAQEYDEWFDKNKPVYESEILALKDLIPREGTGLEIGVGTGRFATLLGIKIGVEPAKTMADMARQRGIDVYEARAEALPFDDESFDFVLMVTVMCFLGNPLQALEEIKRVLKPGGHIVIGIIDLDSPSGKDYERKKMTSTFYKYANFHSSEQVLNWLTSLDFGHLIVHQTVFKSPEQIDAVEPFKNGHGKGALVAIAAKKEFESEKIEYI